MSDFPEIDRAIKALLDICSLHTINGVAQAHPDCGECGSRQDAAALYFVSLVEDCARTLGVEQGQP